MRMRPHWLREAPILALVAAITFGAGLPLTVVYIVRRVME